MSEIEHLPAEHAASVARITLAEQNQLGPKSAADHRAAAQKFKEALAAHEALFGKPFKRNGVWQ
jgi:hypothetical protein